MNNIELESAFMDMIKANERVIYKVCLFYASDDLPLADLYQEVVCNLWQGYPKFRNESLVSTWIYRIALNTCISGVRKEIRRPKGNYSTLMLEDVLKAPESLNTELTEMYKLIEKLRTVERAIVLLYLEEKSYKEIAEIMGLTVSNVATKLKRTKEKLKEMSNC